MSLKGDQLEFLFSVYILYVDHVYFKAYNCYRLTAVAVMLVNPEFSL